MPFQPGNNANPNGRPKGSKTLLNIHTRRNEFRRSMYTLIAIRDGRIEEMSYDRDGNRVAVAAKISDIIAACVKLMEYTAGKPSQHISVDVVNGAEQRPNALIIDLSRRTLTVEPAPVDATLVESIPQSGDNDLINVGQSYNQPKIIT